MYIDPVCHTGRPSDQRIPQEEAVYDKLEELGIEFARVDHDLSLIHISEPTRH